MAVPDSNLADRSGNLVESHHGLQPRVVFFHYVVAFLLLVLASGLAYRQIFKRDIYRESEFHQNQRRTLVPGPRGDIRDREGRVLVGNRQRLSVVLYLDELQTELRRAYSQIGRNYLASDHQLPSDDTLAEIARVAVVQHYLDQVNALLGRDERVDRRDLLDHFNRQLLLPYVLVDDLAPEEFARLIEHLPVNSPLQLYTSSARSYPYGAAAAHTLGSVKLDPDLEADDFPGEDLRTFKMKGTVGRNGLEKQFDSQLAGEAGGEIFWVDRLGYKTSHPIERRLPRQGKDLVTSLDIDLQLAAEKTFHDVAQDKAGAVAAIDVRTGEVLALASEPSYDLNDVSPRISTEKFAEIEGEGGWSNRAVNGLYPPGSTFKILVSIAGLRAGVIDPLDDSIVCTGRLAIAGRTFVEEHGQEAHGAIALRQAIAESCDVYFWTQGQKLGVDALAAEAHRFHLDQRTGIELSETRGMLIPTPAWKQRVRKEQWFPGDTANMSIGQGDVLVTPLDMACFAASVARGEVSTRPTLLHRADAPAQHTEPIGLTAAQRDALLDGMEGCTTVGTAKVLTQIADLRIPGLRIAGKTGTAQVSGNKNVAWFICFAPLEHPEIAVAVTVEGDTPGETYGGGLNAAPIAQGVLRAWWAKKNQPHSGGVTLPGAVRTTSLP